jgi:hypothetical protein
MPSQYNGPRLPFEDVFLLLVQLPIPFPPNEMMPTGMPMGLPLGLPTGMQTNGDSQPSKKQPQDPRKRKLQETS